MTMPIGEAFQLVSDELLLELIQTDTPSMDLYGPALAESLDRGLFDESEFEALFRNFVHKGLDTLWSRYRELDELSWEVSPNEARKEFLSFLQSWETTSSTPLDWPWPITVVPEGRGGRSGPDFDHKYSGLYLCGYRVGKTGGMPTAERREFLGAFFRNDLPDVVERYHDRDYGDPGSETRLRKMANVIATHCRNFKRRDRDAYRYAIADWEADLQYLRVSYYKAGMFPWPPIEP